MLTELIIFSAVFALIAVVYIKILSYEEVLNWWFKFGLKFENKWFWKPIWGCHLCFSGQLALWTYVFNWISADLNHNALIWRFVFFFLPEYSMKEFSLFFAVFSISTTIFFSFLIGKVYDFVYNSIK